MLCAFTCISVPWISYAHVLVDNLGMTQSFCFLEQITCHTFLSACNFRFHWFLFGLELNSISSKVQLKPTFRKMQRSMWWCHWWWCYRQVSLPFPRSLAHRIWSDPLNRPNLLWWKRCCRMNQSTTWWSHLVHIFSYDHARHFRWLFIWSWILLDPLLCRAFTFWFLMQPLKRSDCTSYITDTSWRDHHSCPPLSVQEPKSGRWSVAVAFGGFLASGQPQAISKLADVSALLSSQVCLLILVFPKPLPGRNQPLYPIPHAHIHMHLDLQPESCGFLYYSSLWLILVGLKCLSQGTISLLLLWIPD